MKRILHLYHQNPVIALIINSLAFFLWAATVVLIITVMAVAFTGSH